MLFRLHRHAGVAGGQGPNRPHGRAGNGRRGGGPVAGAIGGAGSAGKSEADLHDQLLPEPDGAYAVVAAAQSAFGDRQDVQRQAANHRVGGCGLSGAALRRAGAAVDQVVRSAEPVHGFDPDVQQAVCPGIEDRLHGDAGGFARSGNAPKGQSRFRLIQLGPAHRPGGHAQRGVRAAGALAVRQLSPQARRDAGGAAAPHALLGGDWLDASGRRAVRLGDMARGDRHVARRETVRIVHRSRRDLRAGGLLFSAGRKGTGAEESHALEFRPGVGRADRAGRATAGPGRGILSGNQQPATSL